MPDLVEEALAAYRNGTWRIAYEQFVAADEAVGLEGDGLDLLAEVAYLVGEEEPTARAWERAHLTHLRGGDRDRAARSAFWLALWFLLRGDTAPATGWLARARTILEEGPPVDCAAQGYLLVPEALEALAVGDHARAEALSGDAAAKGKRFDDRDLWALGWLGRGEALVAGGQAARGMTLLDEVMVSVTAGELSPITTGIVYCAVVEACLRGHDVRRAAQWTEALARWCGEKPDLVPYRGQCLVHRAQVFHARGEWDRAASEATGALGLLSDPPHPARGLALYVLGELHRLRGSYEAAEGAYGEAAQLGFQPLPGLPLLRLAQGRADAAAGGIRRALVETVDGGQRPSLLAAAVEIFITADDRAGVADAVEELDGLVDPSTPPALRALADQARGMAALADGDASSALRSLREACTAWQQLDMPYEAARARLLIADACRAVGDVDGADAERRGALAAFARLGAAPDLQRVAAVGRPASRDPDVPLSARECDVLRLVAAGRTNKEVAAALAISEHTVARHMQNIFTKIGASSRAAAVAIAVERRLV